MPVATREFPPDETMFVLLGLYLGSTVEIHDDEPHLRIEGCGLVPMRTESLDVLEHERPWIEIVGEQPTVTERGEYWLYKWMNKRGRVRDFRGLRLKVR